MARLGKYGLDDIYFRADYANLYASRGRTAELFVFEMESDIFMMPWLVRPIVSDALDGPAFDFETPYGYGGPLSTSDDPAFLAAAWTALSNHCCDRHMISGFIRFHPLLDNHRWAATGNIRLVDDRQTVTLTLGQDRKAIWEGYSASTRNKIRKGEKAGVTVHPNVGREALATFACLYHLHMEELEAHEDYFFGDSYFQAISNLGDDAYRVYLAKHKDQIVGGALVLLSHRWAHYHLSSSPREFSMLSPNNMLRHAVAMNLADGPQERIHFGGGRTADPEDSLLKFKAGYSRERTWFRFGCYIGDQNSYDLLCEHWAEANPHLVSRFGNRFLRYRCH